MHESLFLYSSASVRNTITILEQYGMKIEGFKLYFSRVYGFLSALSICTSTFTGFLSTLQYVIIYRNISVIRYVMLLLARLTHLDFDRWSCNCFHNLHRPIVHEMVSIKPHNLHQHVRLVHLFGSYSLWFAVNRRSKSICSHLWCLISQSNNLHLKYFAKCF